MIGSKKYIEKYIHIYTYIYIYDIYMYIFWIFSDILATSCVVFVHCPRDPRGPRFDEADMMSVVCAAVACFQGQGVGKMTVAMRDSCISWKNRKIWWYHTKKLSGIYGIVSLEMFLAVCAVCAVADNFDSGFGKCELQNQHMMILTVALACRRSVEYVRCCWPLTLCTFARCWRVV